MLFYNEKIFKRCFHWKGKYWYKNITSIPLYFELMHHLIKHGYDEYATWETFHWFTYTMKSILQDYNSTRSGSPIISDDWQDVDLDENEKVWGETVCRMIELLDVMDENSPRYEAKEYLDFDGYNKQMKEMTEAKDEFFKLFSKYFYNLWD